MSDSASAMGLASFSEAWPPPKATASSWLTKDQVTASVIPWDASARRTVAMRCCSVVSTFGATGSTRTRGIGSTSSMPTMRTISSTRSALPSTSARQDGVVTCQGLPLRSTSKPRRASVSACVSSSTSRPERRETSDGGNAMVRDAAGMAPASCIGPAVPPHRSRIRRVA